MSVEDFGDLDGLGPPAFDEAIDPKLHERVKARTLQRGRQIRRRQTAVRRGLVAAAAVVVVGGGVLADHAATSNNKGPSALGSTTTTGAGSTTTIPVSTTAGPPLPITTTRPPSSTTVPITVPTSSSVVQSTTTTEQHVNTTTTSIPPSWSFQAAPANQDQLNVLSCGGPSFCIAASAGTGSSTAVVSTDLGANWSVVQLPAAVIALSCGDATHCVIVASGGGDGDTTSSEFLVTADAGASWSQVPAPQRTTRLESVSCWSGSACLAAGTEPDSVSKNSQQQAVFATSDGGQSWSQRGLLRPGGPVVLDCPGQSSCYAGDGPTVEKSADGGSSWAAISQPANVSRVASLSCPTSSYCFAAGGAAIAVTADGGSSWSAATLPPNITDVSAVECTTTSACWAAATATVNRASGSVGVVLGSTDGGLEWSTSADSPGSSFGAVACESPGCVGVGAGYTATHQGS